MLFVRKASTHPLQEAFGYNAHSAHFHSTSSIIWINYKARRGLNAHFMYYGEEVNVDHGAV